MGSRQVHLSIGNTNLDIIFHVERLPSSGEAIVAEKTTIGLGGAATNYAVAVSRAGHKPVLCSGIGRKYFYDLLKARLEAEGVDTSLLKIYDSETPGVAAILVEPSGERTMIKHRGANRYIEEAITTCLSRARDIELTVVHMASIPPTVARRVLEAEFLRRALFSYDPGGVYAGKIGTLAANTTRETSYTNTIFFFNERESREAVNSLKLEARTTREAAHQLAERLRGTIVVKMGAKGALMVHRDTCLEVEATKPERVVDTTGAGDIFDAYFNVFLLETGDYAKALQAASIAGALKVEKEGGALAAPERSRVEEIMAKTPPPINKC